MALVYFAMSVLVRVWRLAWSIALRAGLIAKWPFSVAYSIYMWVLSAIMIPLFYLSGLATMLGVFCGVALGTMAVKLGLGPAPRQLRSRRASNDFYGSSYSSGFCTPTDTPALFYHAAPQADSDDMDFEEPTDPPDFAQTLPDLMAYPPQRRAHCVAAPAGSCALTSASTLIPLGKSQDPLDSDYLIFYEDSDDGYQTPRRASFQPSEQTIVEEDE